jgi:hypothetical protein
VAGVDIVYRVHALRRMLERGIDEGAVRSAIEAADVVSSHPEDTPYPTCVFPGWQRSRPLHLVAAYNRADDRWIVVPRRAQLRRCGMTDGGNAPRGAFPEPTTPRTMAMPLAPGHARDIDPLPTLPLANRHDRWQR